MSTGIVINNSSDGVIDGITISGFEVGIDLNKSENITIQNVKFRDTTNPAIIDNAKNIKLHNNSNTSQNNKQSELPKLSCIAKAVIKKVRAI